MITYSESQLETNATGSVGAAHASCRLASCIFHYHTCTPPPSPPHPTSTIPSTVLYNFNAFPPCSLHAKDPPPPYSPPSHIYHTIHCALQFLMLSLPAHYIVHTKNPTPTIPHLPYHSLCSGIFSAFPLCSLHTKDPPHPHIPHLPYHPLYNFQCFTSLLTTYQGTPPPPFHIYHTIHCAPQILMLSLPAHYIPRTPPPSLSCQPHPRSFAMHSSYPSLPLQLKLRLSFILLANYHFWNVHTHELTQGKYSLSFILLANYHF